MALPPAYKSARQIAILMAFPFSGADYLLSRLKSHSHLFVCQNLCLMPFKTPEERRFTLYGADAKDGLTDALETLRNCPVRAKLSDIFVSTVSAYRAIQEWCAPRILVDGTEAYSAAPHWSLTEATSVFLNPDFMHLLRNPRGCLGDAQGSCDILKLEKKWVKFTKYMLQLEDADVLDIKYESLDIAVHAILSRLLISTHDLGVDVSKHSAEQIYKGPLQSDTRAVAWGLGYKLLQQRDDTGQFIKPGAVQGLIVWLNKGDTS